MPEQLVEKLAERLGSSGILRGDDVGKRYAADTSGLDPHRPAVVLRPASTEEVAFILSACHQARQPLAVQGGMTGLCGGATPRDGEFALSLERLNGIEDIDAQSMTMTVYAGTPLERVQEAAAGVGLRFPLDLGARGSCTIGGNIATNAGGNEVIRYGMMRALVLGLEVVLPDGTVITSLNRMIKNNAGMDLKQLFIGSEGILGIVTRAVLRLHPEPLSRLSTLAALDDFDAVLRFLSHLTQRLGGGLSAFEVMWADYFDYVLAHVSGRRSPFQESFPLYVLAEYEGTRPDADRELVESVMSDALEQGMLRDVVVAQSEREADDFWRIRDGIGEIAPRLKHAVHFDISVPVKRTAELVQTAHAGLAEKYPDITRLTFGHLADGNLHLVADTGNTADQKGIASLVYGRVGAMGGSISAEHGIGMVKRDYLSLSRSPEEIRLMRALKQTLDPRNILNPGRLLDAGTSAPRA